MSDTLPLNYDAASSAYTISTAALAKGLAATPSALAEITDVLRERREPDAYAYAQVDYYSYAERIWGADDYQQPYAGIYFTSPETGFIQSQCKGLYFFVEIAPAGDDAWQIKRLIARADDLGSQDGRYYEVVADLEKGRPAAHSICIYDEYACAGCEVFHRGTASYVEQVVKHFTQAAAQGADKAKAFHLVNVYAFLENVFPLMYERTEIISVGDRLFLKQTVSQLENVMDSIFGADWKSAYEVAAKSSQMPYAPAASNTFYKSAKIDQTAQEEISTLSRQFAKLFGNPDSIALRAVNDPLPEIPVDGGYENKWRVNEKNHILLRALHDLAMSQKIASPDEMRMLIAQWLDQMPFSCFRLAQDVGRGNIQLKGRLDDFLADNPGHTRSVLGAIMATWHPHQTAWRQRNIGEVRMSGARSATLRACQYN